MKKVLQLIVISLFILSANLFPQSTIVQQIIDSVKIDSLIYRVKELSGEVPTIINGTSQTILSRHMNQSGNALAETYIKQKLEYYGLPVTLQNFSATGNNVLATQVGSIYPNKKFIICAHYDDMPEGTIAPGADDNATGTAVGGYGTILRTTNGGTQWNLQTSGTTSTLRGVSFTDENTGTAVGLDGTILRTTNGGTTWDLQTSGTPYALSSVSFTDANTGTAVGMYGIILRTTNGGTTWTSQTSGTIHHLGDVSFTDTNTGTAVGGSGTILRTTNGGTTWTSQTSGTTNDLTGVSFTDANTGTAVGSYGTILRTTNGGITWTSQISGTTNDLLEVSFTDANTGTAVGLGGTILRTTNGGATFIEEEQINEMPSTYFLSNNFPNPFNPSTAFNYSIPTQSKVIIKVYDILGKEIETLLNEEKPSGTYELTWYAENLPSGVYFYQLNAGSFIQTKKMILMK